MNSFLFLIIFNLLIKLMQDNLLIDVLRFWPSAPEVGEKSLSRLVLFLGKDCLFFNFDENNGLVL